MKKLRTKLLSVISAVCMMLTSLPAITASADYDFTQKNVYITYDGQVVDEFMGIEAQYITYYKWDGPYSCAGYVDKFYRHFFNAIIYDINTYDGKPKVFPINGKTAELREVTNPVPGDIMQNFEYSHVGIVKAVDGNNVILIEQNWKWTNWEDKLVSTINRTINKNDAHFYRLYIGGVEQRIPKAAPKVNSLKASAVTKDGFTLTASASDYEGVTRFEFVTYPKSKGSSAAKTVSVSASGINATATSKVSVKDFGNLGDTYVSTVNAYNKAGLKSSTTINTLVNRTAPVISDIKITGKSGNGYTVTCTVNAVGGIKTVKFPTWTSANSTDDLPKKWETTAVSDGLVVGNTATFRVKASDHNYELGEYNTMIYAYDTYGNYSTKSVQANLSKSIEDCVIGIIPSQTYTGTTIKPAVKVTFQGKQLTKGVDYKLSYINNTKVGKASIRITGLGEFGGSKLVNFNIKPCKVTGVKLSASEKNSVKLKWAGNNSAADYYIYQKINGSWQKIASTTNYSYTVTGLASGTNYEFCICGHKAAGGNDFVSSYSATIKAVTKPDAVTNVSASRPSAANIKVTWNKLDNCDGYAVYTSADGKNFTRKAFVKKPGTTSYTITGVSNKLYVMVRAYKVIGKTYYYSADSAAVKV